MLWPVYLLGNFQYVGVAWVAAFHITKNTTFSQRLILVDNTWNTPLQWHHNGRNGVSTTSFTIVYSAVYSGDYQRKYQSSESLAFVRGIHRWPMNSPHKGSVTRKIFPFNDVIMRKLKHYWSYVRKPPIISGLPLQRTSNSGSVLMSLYHDGGIVLT